MGCLKYGACFSGFDANDQPQLQLRLKDEDLLEAPDDSAFLHSLRISCARVNGVYPPLALVEAFVTEDDHTPRVRRLHLIIVDMTRRRRVATRVSKQLLKVQIDEFTCHAIGHTFERRTIAEKNTADVIMKDGEESGSGADSGWSGVY